MRWILADAEAREKASPTTFEIPPRKARETIGLGAFVKLIVEYERPLENGCTGERMWFEVIGIVEFLGRPVYESLCRSAPNNVSLTSIRDAIILFGPEHVCDITGRAHPPKKLS